MSLETRKSGSHEPGAEVVEQITSFWDRFGKVILTVVAGVIVIGAVAFFTVRSNAQQENAASKQLGQADVLFKRGDLENAKKNAQEVAKSFASTPSGIDAHRVAGDASFWMGNFKDAVTEYKAYLAKRSDGLPAACIRRSLAYALDNDKQYAEAAKAYDAVVGAFDRESSAEMLNAAARCFLAAGQKDEAVKHYDRISKEFGETTFAVPARVKLAELAPASN